MDRVNTYAMVVTLGRPTPSIRKLHQLLVQNQMGHLGIRWHNPGGETDHLRRIRAAAEAAHADDNAVALVVFNVAKAPVDKAMAELDIMDAQHLPIYMMCRRTFVRVRLEDVRQAS